MSYAIKKQTLESSSQQLSFSEISKLVGNKRPEGLKYPTNHELDCAYANKDMRQILTWQRFLSPPKNDSEHNIINKLLVYFGKLKKKIS